MIRASVMQATSRAEAPIPFGQGTRTDSCLAFAITAVIFYIAGLSLPLAIAAKFGEKHSGYLLSGIAGLWNGGNWHLSILVLFCGVVAPLVLTGSLCLLLIVARGKRHRPGLRRWLYVAARIEEWSMPEVQMLGVIVAFTKLSALVSTDPGPGLWCYGLAAFFTILAWRWFEPAALAAALFPPVRRVSE